MIEAIAIVIFIISAIFNAIRKSRAKTAAANTPDSAEVQRRRQEAYERAQREYAARAAQPPAQGSIPGKAAAATPAIMAAPVKQASGATASPRAPMPSRSAPPARAPLPGATRGQAAATVAPKPSARPPQAAPRRTTVMQAASTPMDSSGDESFRRNVRDLESSEARALNAPLTDTPADPLPQSGLAALQQRLQQSNPQTASLISALILSQALGTPRAHGRSGNTNSPHIL